MADKLMYITNVNTQNYNNLWLKHLDTQLIKPTNQNSVKVTKVVKSTTKKNVIKLWGTSVINSQMYPLSMN